MMQEKAMVSDALSTLNSGLKTYTDMISQTENQELRSMLQQMRNETEQSQYELYKIAKSKNYYTAPAMASQNEINSLKSIFSGSTGWAGNTGSTGSMSGIGMGGSSSIGTGTGSMSGIGMSGSGSTGGSGIGSTGAMSGSSNTMNIGK